MTRYMRTLFMFAAIALCVPARAEGPVTPAFTYLGKLNDQGTTAQGTYHLRFRMYDQQAGGTQAGPALTAVIEIGGGRFSVELDFDASPFAGEHAVRRSTSPDTPRDPSPRSHRGNPSPQHRTRSAAHPDQPDPQGPPGQQDRTGSSHRSTCSSVGTTVLDGPASRI